MTISVKNAMLTEDAVAQKSLLIAELEKDFIVVDDNHS
jgi:hypothetical protein